MTDTPDTTNRQRAPRATGCLTEDGKQWLARLGNEWVREQDGSMRTYNSAADAREAALKYREKTYAP